MCKLEISDFYIAFFFNMFLHVAYTHPAALADIETVKRNSALSVSESTRGLLYCYS